MTTLNPRRLKKQAQTLLDDQHPDYRRLILIHTGVVVLLSLISSGLNLYLENEIGETGGLSGLGTRSVLETVQTLMQYAITLFTPFWQAGMTFVAIRFARGLRAQRGDLLTGFRRFSKVLSYNLWLMLFYFAIGLACSYLASIIFTLTPFSDSLVEILAPIAASGTLDLDALPIGELLSAYVPMLVIYALILIPVLVYMHYCIRLAPYFIMDEGNLRALPAMRASAAAMRGSKLAMVKLDLSFWWFYVLEAALMVICYLDILLPMLGVDLPINSTIAYFITLILYCLLELVLHLWKKAQVETTYALAYQQITQPQE